MSNEATADVLVAIADELRALAQNGLHYSHDHYDVDRYERVRALAARTLSVVDNRTIADIETQFRGQLGIRTPLATADAAIFDSEGRLLLTRRSDCGQWCMPGGAADVGESPSEAAVRETLEETKLQVAPTRLLGLYDNRRIDPGAPVQTFCSVFEAEVTGGSMAVTLETTDIAWFNVEQARQLSLFRGHKVKVFDVFAIRSGQRRAPIFD